MFRVGQCPVLPAFGGNPRTFVATTHGDDGIECPVNVVQGFGRLIRQVDIQLGHVLDRFRVDHPGRFGTRAEYLHIVTAEEMTERFCHLAAIGVFDTDKEYALHFTAPLNCACTFVFFAFGDVHTDAGPLAPLPSQQFSVK